MRYRRRAEDLFAESPDAPNRPRVTFLGRLATYRYMDMEAVIGEALEVADLFISPTTECHRYPVFPNIEG
jgi:UDP-galactopyranose mutase